VEKINDNNSLTYGKSRWRRLLLETFVEEFDNGISVPLVDAQCFDDFSLLVQQLDEWVRSTTVPHFQARESVRQITLHKGLYLWVPPQFSSTHFENCEWINLFDLNICIRVTAMIT